MVLPNEMHGQRGRRFGLNCHHVLLGPRNRGEGDTWLISFPQWKGNIGRMRQRMVKWQMKQGRCEATFHRWLGARSVKASTMWATKRHIAKAPVPDTEQLKAASTHPTRSHRPPVLPNLLRRRQRKQFLLQALFQLQGFLGIHCLRTIAQCFPLLRSTFCRKAVVHGWTPESYCMPAEQVLSAQQALCPANNKPNTF